MQAYNQMESAYAEAALTYNSKRLGALNSDSALAVQDWALNADIYRQKVNSADTAWVSGGYKNEVNEISAYIDQVSRRSMSIWFRELKDILDKGKFNDSFSGQTFYPTVLYPANFIKNPNWANFSFNESEYEANYHKKSNSWSAGGAFNIGMWHAAGTGNASTERINENSQFSSYSMSFSMAVVKMLRPWCGTELFSCQGWKLDPGTWQFGDPKLSDGGDPPKGSFIGYSTHAVFVKDLEVTFNKSEWESSSIKKQLGTGGGGGWGPVFIGGKYTRGSEDREYKAHDTGSGFRCPGNLLVGMVNQKHPYQIPNTSPEAKFDD